MKNIQIEELLKNTVKCKRIVNGYIFSGTHNTKNYIYAKNFAKMVLCLNEKEDCNKCKSCLMFDDNNHPDYYEINKDLDETIKIDEIRQMQEKVIEKPIVSNKKVYLINNAENMNKEAQNCLLKTLEEPPEFVTILLVTNNENNILVTIKSRCTKLMFTEENVQELTDDEKNRYEVLEEVFGNIENYQSIDLLNRLDILYNNKEDSLRNLELINMILMKNARKKPKYLDYISYVEQTKKKIKEYNNFDMSIDNLILKIWE